MRRIEPHTIPNIITVGRVVLAPAVFFLALGDSAWSRGLAFLLFTVAAVSDVWDGRLARKYGWVTDFGKLMDPLADKLLLVATFVPFFVISHRAGPIGDLPYWGELPVWVLIVIFGREILVTVMRQLAARNGQILAAGVAGKYKAFFQSLFCGGTLLWYALQAAAAAGHWHDGLWRAWQEFLHGPFIGLTLAIALLLTLYSMGVYILRWESLTTPAGKQ
jgi:CDP-diacylglycerol--glycerol-3-phosphate 3-phosphatidyltransferase